MHQRVGATTLGSDSEEMCFNQGGSIYSKDLCACAYGRVGWESIGCGLFLDDMLDFAVVS